MCFGRLVKPLVPRFSGGEGLTVLTLPCQLSPTLLLLFIIHSPSYSKGNIVFMVKFLTKHLLNKKDLV